MLSRIIVIFLYLPRVTVILPLPKQNKISGFQNKNRVAILAELDKEKRKLLMQNQSSTNHPGASIALSRPSLNKDFRDHAEQQHIAAQQKAALQHAHAHSSGYFITQDSAFGNLILPVLPRLDPE